MRHKVECGGSMSDGKTAQNRIADLLNGEPATDKAADRWAAVRTAVEDVHASRRDLAEASAHVEALQQEMVRLGSVTALDASTSSSMTRQFSRARRRLPSPASEGEEVGLEVNVDELQRELDQALADLEARQADARQAEEEEHSAIDAAAQDEVDKVEDGEQPEQAAEEARKEIERLRAENDANLKKLGQATWLVLTVITALFVVFKLPPPRSWGVSDWSVDSLTPGVSAAVTAIIGWVLVSLLMLMTRASGGLRRIVIGKDGRFSTGMVQSVIWTAALFYALLFLTLRTAGDGTNPFDDLDAAYLVLLGGPFAATAVARATISSKVASGAVQSVPAETTAVKDVVTDAGGNTDLVDVQFLAFNVIALTYFVIGLVGGETKELPELPEGLVALTSLGALTYATNKALARNAPVITSVVRARGRGTIRPGDIVELRGTNLVPEGAAEVEYLALIRVRFGEVAARLVPLVKVRNPSTRSWGSKVLGGRQRQTTASPGATTNVVRAQVPWGLEADVYDVTLVTAAGVATDPVKVDVDEDVPTVLAVIPETLRPGGTAQVVGRSFHSAAKSGPVLVSFNGRTFSAESVGVRRGGVERLRVTVPQHLEGSTVAVGVVATSGKASETVRVPVITR